MVIQIKVHHIVMYYAGIKENEDVKFNIMYTKSIVHYKITEVLKKDKQKYK